MMNFYKGQRIIASKHMGNNTLNELFFLAGGTAPIPKGTGGVIVAAQTHRHSMIYLAQFDNGLRLIVDKNDIIPDPFPQEGESV